MIDNTLIINFSQNEWFRFSKYELFAHEKGTYIIPSKGADKILYNPFHIAEDLITDYLNFGKALDEGMDGNAKTHAALSLVQKYGLFGIYDFIQYNIDMIEPDYKNILRFYNDGELDKEVTYNEFLIDFFPAADRQPPKTLKDTDFKADQLQFESNYSERVGWIAYKSLELYSNFKKINEFRHTPEIENLGDFEYFNKVIDCKLSFTMSDLVLSYDEINGASLSWKANNLYKMLDVIYLMKMTDKKNGISICLNCGKTYPKTRSNNTNYCNEKCGNSYRAKKSIKLREEKKKNLNRKNE